MRKKLRFFIGCLLACLAIQSCGFFGNGDKIDHLTGIVKDEAGNPLKDVVVTSANVSVTTDENGIFNLERIENVDSRYVVSFDHKGYFRVVKSGDENSAEVLEVVMLPTKKEGVSNSVKFIATKGSKVKVGETQVNIPANSLVRTDGTLYKGNVDFKMLYLNPNREDFAATMPGGDLAAKDTAGTEKMLVSYGMIDVVMTDEKGNKLQLKSGTESEITFPIPEGMADKAPNEMPLWSFNEENGVWEQSGVAVREGDIYKGTVGHFSWVNLDDPKDYCVLYGKVEDEDGNALSGIRLTVDQVSVYTKADGSYNLRIPCETEVDVTVKSADYNDYLPEVSVKVPGQPGNSKHKENIKLPNLPTIKGQLSNTCSDKYPFTLYCKYQLDDKQKTSGLSMCKTDGSFAVRLPMGANNVVLYVSAPDGQTTTQEVSFDGQNAANVGTLSVCYEELIKREQPRLSIDGQESTAIDYDDCDYVDFKNKGKSIEIGFNKDLKIEIDDYSENVNQFDARISLSKQGYVSNSAQVERKKVDSKVQLKITSVGYVEKDGQRTDAKFDAVVYTTSFYSGPCNSLSKICIPRCLSTVRMPVPQALEQDLWGMPDIMLCYDNYSQEVDVNVLLKATESQEPLNFIMTYKTAQKSDLELLEKQLEEKGFVYKSDNSTGGKKYELNGVTVSTHYGNLILTKCGIDKKVKMGVEVTTGLDLWFKNLVKKYFGFDWF